MNALHIRNMIIGFAVAETVFLVDFLSKWWATRVLSPVGHPGHTLSLGQFIYPDASTAEALSAPNYAPIVVIPNFFNLYLAHNTGGAFSVFSGNPELLAGVSLVIVAGLLWWACTFDRNRIWPFVGVGMLVGGALGNIVDRVRFEYVVDYLDCYIGQSHWPTFNVADICVDAGLAVLIILAVFTKQLDPEPPKVEEPATTSESE